MRPRIAIPADTLTEATNVINERNAPYAPRPAIEAIVKSGGVPVILPSVDPKFVDDYIDLFDGIVAAGLPGDYVVELSLDELLAYHRDMVDIEHSFKMVALMLNDSREETCDDFFVRFEILIDPFKPDIFHTRNSFRKSRQAQTAFITDHGLTVENLDFRIYEGEFPTLAFGKTVFDWIGIYDNDSVGKSDLRSGETDTFAIIHGLIHFFDKFLETVVV